MWALLVVLALGVLHPALGAGFVLVDDHEILSYSDALVHSRQIAAPPDLAERVLRAEPAAGRVRPLYWVIRMAEIALLGQRPVPWHALYLALGAIAACLFYTSLRLAGVRAVPALAAGGWLVVAPGVSTVWIRLGPQESLGTVLVLLSAIAAARGAASPARLWDALFASALIASLLIKESFILAAPAIIGFRLFVRDLRGQADDLLWPSLVPAVVAGSALVLAWSVAARAGLASYGGKFLAPTRPGLLADGNLLILALLGGVLTPLLVAGPLVAWVRRRATATAMRQWAAGASLVLLMIFPQLVLYRDGGFAVDRYVLPAGLGLATGIAAGCSWLWERGRSVAAACVGVWIAFVGIFAIGTWRTAEVFRADSQQLEALVRTVSGSTPRGAIVAIAADPARDFEASIALRYQLVAAGRDDLDIRLLATESPPNEAPSSRDLRAQLTDTYFANRAGVAGSDCARTWGIVLLTSQPYGSDAWACPAVPEPVSHSFQEVTVSPILRSVYPDVRVGYVLATFT